MKKNLLILLFFAFVVNAKAALLLEPYVGFAMNGTAEIGSSEDDYSGTTVGGRVGWQMLGLFLAADLRQSTFDVDGTDFDETQYSAVVGYDFPILVRAYAQYVLGGSGEFDGGSDLEDPTGTILGVGFTGLPFVSLNLEMAKYKYESIGGSSGEVDFDHILLSVSLPLTF